MLHGQELALWRSSSGAVQAWENRCPHRSVRLTLGYVAGDQLVCRYHGWRYRPDGRCAFVPATPTLAPPPTACVRSYPCREADGVVWASLALLPSGYPPLLGALDACRSFVVEQSADELARRIADAGFEPGASAAVWHEADSRTGDPVVLLLQPMTDATTSVHLLLHRGADASDRTARRLAASRRLKQRLAQWAEAEVHHA